jgi:transcriptional regulator with XRE-family HTH domain
MDDARLGRLIRVLRHRRGWRQVDLAARAGVGPGVVAKLEAGRVGPMRTGTICMIVSVFGLSYEGGVRGLGADEHRLLDEGHSALQGVCATWLSRLGWQTQAEISYSEWGERGSVDVLAWHAPSGSLLVIEIKTELPSIEATLRKLDEKVRLAPTMARRCGWHPASISRLLVLPEDRTQRRRVAAHASVLNGAYPSRTRAVRAWCTTPAGSIAGLLFLADPGAGRTMVGWGRRSRIRLARRIEP